MKHSIRFVQFKFYPSGKGKSILILRGMDVREYSYSHKNVHNLNMLTAVEWDNKFYANEITAARKYKES